MVSAPHPVPTVVRALYALVDTAVADDPNIRVDLGNPGEFDEFDAIGIGLATTPVDPVEDRQTTRTMGYDVHEFDVVCVALSWTGDDDARAEWMSRAFELTDIVRDELATPQGRTLGLDKVLQAAPWVSSTSFGWVLDRQSLKAQVEFSVRCKAYRARR